MAFEVWLRYLASVFFFFVILSNDFFAYFLSGQMASSSDSWMKEYNEAVKLADDISGMISERNSLPSSGPDTQRHASAIRRKITILGTRLDSLQSLLSKLPGKQPM